MFSKATDDNSAPEQQNVCSYTENGQVVLNYVNLVAYEARRTEEPLSLQNEN